MPLLTFLRVHHAEIVYITGLAIALFNVAVKLAMKLHTPEEWVRLGERRPRILAFIRLMEAFGINPVSVIQALVDLKRNEASPGTLAAAKAIGVSASKPIFAPKGAVALARAQAVTVPDVTPLPVKEDGKEEAPTSSQKELL